MIDVCTPARKNVNPQGQAPQKASKRLTEVLTVVLDSDADYFVVPKSDAGDLHVGLAFGDLVRRPHEASARMAGRCTSDEAVHPNFGS